MKMTEPILRALSEPVLVLDAGLEAVMANPAFYDTFRIPPGQLQGKPVQDLIAGENGQPSLRSIAEAAIGHDIGVERVIIECAIPPGTRKFMKVSAKQLTHPEGLTGKILIELRDVTFEIEAEKKINALNNALHSCPRQAFET